MNDAPITDIADIPIQFESADTTYDYEAEQIILGSILEYYDAALAAFDDHELGLAESKIDSASVLSVDVDLMTIDDEVLVTRFQDAYASLYQLFGLILHTSDEMSQQDPTAWLNDLSEYDTEQFKNAKWTDDELRGIVRKISLMCDLPLDYNDKVKNSILFFQTNKRKEMEKWLARSGRYVPMLRQILKEEGVPEDLVYVSMIESGFSPIAYSRAHCVGLWQFLYSTGRLYGLNRTEWIDERRDPEKSTRAAAAHLKDLYKIYGDWRLVMAAYNCGPTRVTRQFRNSDGNIDFWEMTLPRETMNYVPSFMAALVISKAPQLFGFDNIEYEDPLEYDTVEIHPYTSLATAAKCTGVAVDVIKNLNTELRQASAPVGKTKYALKIPKGTKETFEIAYAKIPATEYSPPKLTAYRVKRGDTLSQIAQRTGVSVSRLMAANNIRDPRRLMVGQQLNIPGYTTTATSSTSTSIASAPVAVSTENATTYTVKKDDSLWLIANRNNTTVTVLQAMNKMGSRSRIVPGQKILIPGIATASTTSTANPAPARPQVTASANGQITYVIQRNDTLYDIAQKYSVTHQQIMDWNKIKNHRTIKPGQKIIIKTN